MAITKVNVTDVTLGSQGAVGTGPVSVDWIQTIKGETDHQIPLANKALQFIVTGVNGYETFACSSQSGGTITSTGLYTPGATVAGTDVVTIVNNGVSPAVVYATVTIVTS